MDKELVQKMHLVEKKPHLVEKKPQPKQRSLNANTSVNVNKITSVLFPGADAGEDADEGAGSDTSLSNLS